MNKYKNSRSSFGVMFCIAFFTSISTASEFLWSEGLMLPEDCYPEERYDDAQQVCYLPCEHLTEEQCIRLEEKVYGSDEWFDEYDSYTQTHKSSEDIQDEPITLYDVDAQLQLKQIKKTASIDDGYNAEIQLQIWNLIRSVLPNEFLRAHVAQYAATYDDELLGYVNLTEAENKWVFGMNPNEFSDPIDPDFIHTLVHEFAHIVFLNHTQLHEDFNNCRNYLLDEGCTNSDSYMNQFYRNFWQAIHKENKAPADASDIDQKFYQKYKHHFFSEYASSNPVEDAAEVFTMFVLQPKPRHKTALTNKVLFLYQFNKLMLYRAHIRNALQKMQLLPMPQRRKAHSSLEASNK